MPPKRKKSPSASRKISKQCEKSRSRNYSSSDSSSSEEISRSKKQSGKSRGRPTRTKQKQGKKGGKKSPGNRSTSEQRRQAEKAQGAQTRSRARARKASKKRESQESSSDREERSSLESPAQTVGSDMEPKGLLSESEEDSRGKIVKNNKFSRVDSSDKSSSSSSEQRTHLNRFEVNESPMIVQPSLSEMIKKSQAALRAKLEKEKKEKQESPIRDPRTPRNDLTEQERRDLKYLITDIGRLAMSPEPIRIRVRQIPPPIVYRPTNIAPPRPQVMNLNGILYNYYGILRQPPTSDYAKHVLLQIRSKNGGPDEISILKKWWEDRGEVNQLEKSGITQENAIRFFNEQVAEFRREGYRGPSDKKEEGEGEGDKEDESEDDGNGSHKEKTGEL